MWSLYAPNGFSECYRGMRGAVDRLLVLCREHGWKEAEAEVENLLKEVSAREVRDTYLVQTPAGVYQIDHLDTLT